MTLYLLPEPSDAQQPSRRRYWLSTESPPSGWRVFVEDDVWESWKEQAVPADCPDDARGSSKASWRMSNRFALVRTRDGSWGVDAALMGARTFEPLERT